MLYKLFLFIFLGAGGLWDSGGLGYIIEKLCEGFVKS